MGNQKEEERNFQVEIGKAWRRKKLWLKKKLRIKMAKKGNRWSEFWKQRMGEQRKVTIKKGKGAGIKDNKR